MEMGKDVVVIIGVGLTGIKHDTITIKNYC